jgi:hypothetical protein
MGRFEIIFEANVKLDDENVNLKFFAFDDGHRYSRGFEREAHRRWTRYYSNYYTTIDQTIIDHRCRVYILLSRTTTSGLP